MPDYSLKEGEYIESSLVESDDPDEFVEWFNDALGSARNSSNFVRFINIQTGTFKKFVEEQNEEKVFYLGTIICVTKDRE